MNNDEYTRRVAKAREFNDSVKNGKELFRRGKMTRHQEIQEAIEKLLNARGMRHMSVTNYTCFKCGQVQNGKAKGHPDIEVYLPHFYIEIKVSPDKLKPEQKAIKELIDRAGIPYIIVRDNTDALIEYLGNATLAKKKKRIFKKPI